MTLIITELNNYGANYGIAMVADSALTINSYTNRGLLEDRAFSGLIKLLPIPKIQAGISYWGWTMMPPNAKAGEEVWMDWWLRKFLSDNRNNFHSLEELAFLLEEKLRSKRGVPPLTDEYLKLNPDGNGGIHLAGFTDYESKKVPCFWHIHNGISQELLKKKLDPKLVNANYDCPPERFIKKQRVMIRNGDYKPYALFFDKYLSACLDDFRTKMNIYIPMSTLNHHAEFYRSLVQFISSLYAVGGSYSKKEGVLIKKARTVGNEVSVLTITEEGISKYISQ